MANGDPTAIGMMRARYVLVLGMLGTLAAVNYFLLEEKVRASHSAARAVELVGRQRYLLQHTASLAQRLIDSGEPSRQEALRSELQRAARLMQTSHRSLMERPATTEETRVLYVGGPESLDRMARRYFENLEGLAALPVEQLSPEHPVMEEISAAASGNRMMAALDRAVAFYQTAHEQELSVLRQLQRLALGSTLVLIGLTALLVFLPMERRIRSDMERLQVMNANLQQRVAEHSATADQHAQDAARSEAALNEQTGILRLILDSMADGVVVVDREGRFLLFNPAAERILGVGPGDMPPERWPEHFGLYLPDRVTPYPPEHLPLVRAMRGEAVDRAEVFMRPASGPAGIWLSTSARPLVDERGEVRGAVAVFHNMTGRKQAEEALRQSEALYTSLIDALPLHYFRKDLDGAFTFANQRFCDVLKIPLDDLLGKTDFDFYPVELAEKYLRDDHYVIDTGQTFEDIEQHRKPSGETIQVQVLKAPVYDAQRNIIGIQGIFWEVSQRARSTAAPA